MDSRRARPAAFLDRDGTIISEKYYLADPAGVELVPGAAEALRELRELGLAVVVITNQSGIARGLYTEEGFHAVQRRLEEVLAQQGVRLDGVYYCPHHPDVTGPCDCRKPGLGLFRRAGVELRLDLGRSFYLGDRLKDVLPALELGGTPILLRTGYGAEDAARAPAAVHVVADLEAATALIRKRTRAAQH